MGKKLNLLQPRSPWLALRPIMYPRQWNILLRNINIHLLSRSAHLRIKRPGQL